MDTITPPNLNATAPYDSAAMADLILRSSNHVDFYVLGTFLRYVSPTFSTTIALKTDKAAEDNEKRDGYPVVCVAEDNEKRDGYPVVCVAEDSSTLRLLLDSIYPASEERRFDDVGLFWKVAKASQKYCMKIIEDKLRKRIFSCDLIEAHSLRMYAVATDLGWDDVAIAAARQTLQTPLESLPYVDELKCITGTGFYRFLEYRLRCKASGLQEEEFTKFPSVVTPCSLSNAVDASDISVPFNSSAPADLILRSSNSVDFYVLGGLMCRLSTVFENMFPFSPEHEAKNGIPVLPVEETSKVLHCLLSTIYHDLDEPDMKQCHLYIKVVLAARKYRMASIERKLRKQAADSQLIIDDPLRAYVIAIVLGWEDLAKTAALNTFHQPLDKLAYVDELHLISGADLYRLMYFRFRCADAASNALMKDPMFPDYGFGKWDSHFQKIAVGDDRERHYDSSNPSSVYTKLKVSPRGSTVSNIYSKHLKLDPSKTGKFEMTPAAVFDFIGWDGERIVENAIAKVDFEKAEAAKVDAVYAANIARAHCLSQRGGGKKKIGRR